MVNIKTPYYLPTCLLVYSYTKKKLGKEIHGNDVLFTSSFGTWSYIGSNYNDYMFHIEETKRLKLSGMAITNYLLLPRSDRYHVDGDDCRELLPEYILDGTFLDVVQKSWGMNHVMFYSDSKQMFNIFNIQQKIYIYI